MASVTRSNRRAEGLHPHHANAPLTRSAPGLFHHGGGRTKRGLDANERDFGPLKPKKARIEVEILAKHTPIPTDAVKVPRPRPRPVVPIVTTPVLPPKPPVPDQPQDPNLTRHQAKVINGIKHELDRLQPQVADTREQGRKLRSQEATRFKSELSAYFPDYDEVIGNDPREQHVLNIETPIVVFDSNVRRAVYSTQRAATGGEPHHNVNADFAVRPYGDALFTDTCDSQRIDFSFLEAQHKSKGLEDPLPDSVFETVHKRAERLERSIRNTEKGRAQHEKDQIIRLLEGLQGHDWLRVMGVSGITETKKKSFEPARAHFIKGCQAIIEKFRTWNLEEKRRKAEKDRALAEQAEQEAAAEEGQEVDEDVEEVEREEADEEEDEEAEEEDEAKAASEDSRDRGTPQDDSSEASSPAKQLREEALARSKLANKGPKKTAPSAHAESHLQPPRPPEPPKEFKSLFSKKYERDSALNRHRRAGRKVLAWGHPLPEMPEIDFILPKELRDEDTLKSRAREKRKDRRGSKH